MKIYDVWIEKIVRAEYPKELFHLKEIYPELSSAGYIMECDHKNETYGIVRQIL